MSFLPEDYKIPKPASNYMKFEEGTQSFRILDSAIIGYEYWNMENKPVRSKTPYEEMPDDIKPNKDGQFKISHFWAFPVWNYQVKRVQILEVTQTSVQKAIKALVSNPKWGNPRLYDIAVTRVDEGITSYSVQGEPPIGEPSKEIMDAYKAKKIRLEALFEGGDPFLTE